MVFSGSIGKLYHVEPHMLAFVVNCPGFDRGASLLAAKSRDEQNADLFTRGVGKSLVYPGKLWGG
jgi:hypothetical protein